MSIVGFYVKFLGFLFIGFIVAVYGIFSLFMLVTGAIWGIVGIPLLLAALYLGYQALKLYTKTQREYAKGVIREAIEEADDSK